MLPTTLIPAAQYVRMSTELQEYSIENQKVAIQQYAQQHGFSIVKTYADAGRSGITLKRRGALTALLTDVLKRRACYRAILVYDVSRWGRFQDADEAAHYEFLCKKAGIPVHYCAELFPNDGTLASSIFKALKRTMAAEYSRELGVKVFAAQRRLAQLGYKMGGRPVYGLRRFVKSADPKREFGLRMGQRKSLALDHVVLVPGPKREVECVRSIFATALQNISMSDIARKLNRQQIPYFEGREWNCASISRTLHNPTYVGCSTWGKTSCKLHTLPMRVPPEQWTVRPKAFSPIINQKTFDRVQAILKKRLENWTKKEMLGGLRRLLRRKGKLTEKIIVADPNTPGITTYRHHFGSFSNIFRQIGYDPPAGNFVRVEHREITYKLRAQLLAQITDLFPQVTSFRLPGRSRMMVQFDNSIRVSVIICRSCRMRGGILGWLLNPIPRERDYITLVCRLNRENKGIHSLFLFDGIEHVQTCRIKEGDPWWKTGRQLELWELYKTTKEISHSGKVAS